jgi:hypothetical protein
MTNGYSRLESRSHKFISTAIGYRKITSEGVKIFQSICITHITNGRVKSKKWLTAGCRQPDD